MGTTGLSLAEEKRRPRESSFGALGAGLITRGPVTPEMLFEDGGDPQTRAPDRPDIELEGLLGDEAIVAPRGGEWIVVPPRDMPDGAALAEAEKKRTRVSSFASLSGGMVERGGALARQVLSAAQIDLLLKPETYEHDELTGLAEEEEAAAAPDAAVAPDADPAEAPEPVVTGNVAVKPLLTLVVHQHAEPSKPVPTALDFLKVHVEEPEPEVATTPPRAPFGWIRIWLACALVLLFLSLPEPTSQPEPSLPVAVATSEPSVPESPVVSIEAPDVADPPAQAASMPTPDMAPAIEAAEEPAPAETTPTTFTRRRPGASDEPPPAMALPTPPTVELPAPVETPAELIRRGDSLLNQGNVADARLAFERAAEAGDRRAMTRLARTYDPAHIKAWSGVRPDVAQARYWYAKAAETRTKAAPVAPR